MKKRAVVVAGARTPFVKAFGAYTKMDSIALGDAAVAALLERTEVPKREIDSVKAVFPGVPIVGFLTYGEIARYKGRLDGWHNSTAVVTAIPSS